MCTIHVCLLNKQSDGLNTKNNKIAEKNLMIMKNKMSRLLLFYGGWWWFAVIFLH